MNCKDMMQIPELTEVLKLKAGKNGLEQSVRWIYFADCLQCVKSEYKIENYIHGDEFVVLTNPSVTDDSRKLMEMIRQMYGHGITALGINEGQISEYCSGGEFFCSGICVCVRKYRKRMGERGFPDNRTECEACDLY